MLSDLYNNPVFQSQDILKLLYSGGLEYLDQIIAEDSFEVKQLIEHSGIKLKTSANQSIPKEEFDRLQQDNWFIPEEYQTFDVKSYCLSKCDSIEKESRVLEELAAFEEKNMMNILRVLKYVVDFLRENKVLWGVGRGSSVSSYVLFLLEVHKIDSMKYKLDWHEFLR